MRRVYIIGTLFIWVTNMKSNGIRITVQVKPGAIQNAVTRFKDDVLQVKVAAPPVEGRANKELIVYLSKVFGVRKSNVVIEKGLTSRRKIISIVGLNQEQLVAALSEVLASGT